MTRRRLDAAAPERAVFKIRLGGFTFGRQD
jgi:hypothetical protein